MDEDLLGLTRGLYQDHDTQEAWVDTGNDINGESIDAAANSYVGDLMQSFERLGITDLRYHTFSAEQVIHLYNKKINKRFKEVLEVEGNGLPSLEFNPDSPDLDSIINRIELDDHELLVNQIFPKFWATQKHTKTGLLEVLYALSSNSNFKFGVIVDRNNVISWYLGYELDLTKSTVMQELVGNYELPKVFVFEHCGLTSFAMDQEDIIYQPFRSLFEYSPIFATTLGNKTLIRNALIANTLRRLQDTVDWEVYGFRSRSRHVEKQPGFIEAKIGSLKGRVVDEDFFPNEEMHALMNLKFEIDLGLTSKYLLGLLNAYQDSFEGQLVPEVVDDLQRLRLEITNGELNKSLYKYFNSSLGKLDLLITYSSIPLAWLIPYTVLILKPELGVSLIPFTSTYMIIPPLGGVAGLLRLITNSISLLGVQTYIDVALNSKGFSQSLLKNARNTVLSHFDFAYLFQPMFRMPQYDDITKYVGKHYGQILNSMLINFLATAENMPIQGQPWLGMNRKKDY